MFPKTAKEYLIHLHTPEHIEKSGKKSSDAPWREAFQKANDVSTYPNAPTKQAPIRGLQFFEPSSAWFCKLCQVFMGDVWCATLHLKSKIHTEKYSVRRSVAILLMFRMFITRTLLNRNLSIKSRSLKRSG